MDIQIGSNAIYTASMQVFNYRVDVGGVTIYRGRAIASPSGRVTVNVSNIVEDYLNSDEFPKRNVDPILYSEDGGYVKARLYRINADETTTLVGEYNFLRSYDEDWSAGIYDSREEVWTGQSITMSNPINGRLDPRMQQLYTVYRRTSGETINWGIVPKFRIIPNKIIADPDGGTYTLIIEANVPFTASTQDGWVSISGSGSTYVVTVTPNPGEDRNGGIILSYLDENDNPATTVIPVVQEAVSARIIPETINFGPDGGESRFTVVSNIDVTPTTSADWLTFVPVRTGDGFVTYKLVAASNRDNTEDRTATINARGAVLTVNQEAFAVSVVIDKTEYNWEGEEGTLTVTANGYYEITTDSDWITISPSSGYSGVTSFNIEVEENDTDSGRTGYINVGGTIIEITQEKQAWVSIKPETWIFPATGGSVTFTISDRHNRGWNFNGTAGILARLSQTEGTGNTQVVMTVEPTTTAVVRTFILSLESESTGESIRLQLRQAAPVITVTPSTITVPDTGGTFSFTVESEVDFRLRQYLNDGDWITLSATSGTAGTTTFTFTADTTTSQFERTGFVRVFNTRMLTVIQEAGEIQSENYLTMNILTGGTVEWLAIDDRWSLKTIEYSTDSGVTWNSITSYPRPYAPTITVSAGDTIMFRGNNSKYTSDINISYHSYFGGTAKFDLKGNILSLIYGDNFRESTSAGTEAFYALFAGSNAVNARRMVLPSEFGDQCFMGMFAGCSYLTATPLLPSTSLTFQCYDGMFQNCTSLTTAPELPALTGTTYCYRNMFSGCTSLTAAPALPATVLERNAYEGMFSGCIRLTSAPAILPATSIGAYCYKGMFQGCTSLTTAPELPATALYDECYMDMFNGCTSLKTVQATLPATELKNSCYYNMFYGCTSLTTAPILPAATLADYCYRNMFFGCRKLNYIKCLATNISATYCVTYWVNNVASTGTFVKAASMNDWDSGESGIPTGWTVINE